MALKKGDLIKFKRTGRMATVMCDEYTARFIDAQDEEMIAHGMGHMAGSYESAVDICYMDTMETRRKVRVNSAVIEVISLK